MIRRKQIWTAILSILILFISQKSVFADMPDGFLPGGAWEEDKGIIIWEEPYDYNAPDMSEEEVISPEGASDDPFFDPREEGLVTEVKDQGGYALCWDFAAVSTAESALIRQGYDRSIDLSEYQTAGFAYIRQKEKGAVPENMSFETFCNDGGTPSYVWELWMEGFGPAGEDQYPGIESISQNGIEIADIRKDHIKRLSDITNLSGDRESIKQAIRQSGAVFALYYSYPMYYNDGINDQKDSSYYMPYQVKSKNHAISIVGWDDAFPAGSFVKDFVQTKTDEGKVETPLPDGAWLIKNSWGKRAYKTPDEGSGYYWISYFDQSLSGYTALFFEEPQSSEEDVITDGTKDEVHKAECPDVTMPDFGKDKDAFQKADQKAAKLELPGESEERKAVKREKKVSMGNIKIRGITYAVKGDHAIVKCVKGKKRKVKIPASIKYSGRKYPVTRIGKKAFCNNMYVRKVILGKNIRSIGKEAFKGCRNLRTIIVR